MNAFMTCTTTLISCNFPTTFNYSQLYIVIKFESRTFLTPQSPRMEWAIQVSHHPWEIVAIESFLNLIMLEPLGPMKGAFSVGAQASCDLSSLVRAAPASSPLVWDSTMNYFIQHRVLITSLSPTPKHERQETI